jgi:organic radical activating enzyme
MSKDFFCPAKWDELYLYLNHGLSNSCSHPLPHHIPLDELKDNLSALHNTKYKLGVRSEMLDGGRPKECHMCWHLEDKGISSDRFEKFDAWGSDSSGYSLDANHKPRLVEVVFDNLCNLSCSYCDSGQSSTWAAVLNRTGPWGLSTDHRRLYDKIHIKPGSTKQEYLDAWNDWWPQIKDHVVKLKISGGEPLLSPSFWRTMDALQGNSPNLELSINSNMSVSTDRIHRLIGYQDGIKSMNISASIDATGALAEFCRAGLDYDLFLENIDTWLSESKDNCTLWLQSTVNILNVWGLKDKFQLALDLRSKHGYKVGPSYSTIIRYPEFQSMMLLPKDMRLQISQDLYDWSEKNAGSLIGREKNMIYKIAKALIMDPQPVNDLDANDLKKDLIKFLARYRLFSKHQMQDLYPKDFLEWLDQ